jgi:hypothetical protein
MSREGHSFLLLADIFTCKMATRKLIVPQRYAVKMYFFLLDFFGRRANIALTGLVMK